ncbi:MAG: cell division protein FtsL [Candidatus Rokubacteria bacterium]|nr:cell division protein FtsL [Candidatus Rokubacteria bacterium]MBI3825736.1 cell division protein FtsL [Candidatus Rokubacteria bacterium]
MRRSLVAAAVCAGLLVAGGLAVVGLRVQQVHLAYQRDKLVEERARVETLIRQLEIELATLRSPARVETRARQLGMASPSREQVRLAREYVSGGGGLAAARTARLEALVR